MPESTAKLLDLLGQPADQRDFAAVGDADRAGHGAAGAGRRVPALPGGVIHVTLCHIRRARGVLRSHAQATSNERCHDRATNRVVVIGGGYAGMLAANHLRHARRLGQPDITLVNPRPKFVERIRLHQLRGR